MRLRKLPARLFVILPVIAFTACTGPSPGSSAAPSPAVAPVKPAADPTLIHRYSFTDAARDSVGKTDGALKNGAKVVGGKLVLDNAGKTSADASLAYLEFPSSIIPKSGSVSIVLWFTASNTDNFARLIDFGDREGDQGRAFIYFTPRNSNDDARVAITATDTSVKTFIDSTKLDDGKPHMVAIVVDDAGKKLHLLVDGKEPVAAADLGENVLAKVRPTHSWVGKSGFDQDGALSAAVDELRIYSRAMTLEEAAALARAGADELVTIK